MINIKPIELLLLSMLLISSLLTITAKADEQRPNILFLLTDDMAYWATGYQNSEFLTPQIDELAQQGVTFSNHYNTTSICMASRATIMTGLLEYRTGTNFMHGSMQSDIFETSYPILLKKAGYLTGFVGKFGFETPPLNPEKLPADYQNLPVDKFDFWAGGKGQLDYTTANNYYLKQYAKRYPHVTQANGAAAIDFIREAHKQNKPFNLSVSFKAPHAPVRPDPQFSSLFEGREYSKPANYWRDKGKHLALQAKLGRQYLTEDGFGFAPDTFNQRMADYNQQIYGVDVVLGRLRAELDKLGMTDNTVIIFTADNGYQNGNYGFSRKVLPYEESVKVPLIIYDPRPNKMQAGSQTEALTANTDFVPTILELAGIKPDKHLDGVSLLEVLRHPSQTVHQFVPLLNVWGSAPTHYLGVVTPKWKYIYWPYAEGISESEELFDLSQNMPEMRNLVRNKNYVTPLHTLHNLYDLQVKNWQHDAIHVNGYVNYATIFDRNIAWKQKKSYFESSFIHDYQQYFKQYQQDPEEFEKTFGITLPKPMEDPSN
ncbi:sulfatase-like hydrolase/transferase [Alteromonas sp. 14N.309.X.WAT.G.H12]|uniref:sulfatase-like hydrolase/transferase n=1 Tax=Alteromonas sp. 14N.309.X.WAT.G.H12 TaxID=3120824 RepID=UPI002FD74092